MFKRKSLQLSLTVSLIAALGMPVYSDNTSPAEPETNESDSVETGIGESDAEQDPWLIPASNNSHPWLTSLQLTTVILGGTAWYWLDRERQVADWDYPGWQAKATFKKEIFIFDNNPFMVNYSWHTFAGSASHVLGRANGLGMLGSFALGTGASLVWEYGIESRELISLNDLLMTNTTGLAVGEFFHRLGQYARVQDDGLGWDVLRWTLGVPHSVHAVWDKSLQEQPKIRPSFRFSYGLSTAGVTQQDGPGASEQSERHLIHSLAMDGSFVVLENYMQPGARSGFFRNANFTSFRLRLSRGGGDATDVYGDTFLAGYRSEDIPEEGEGGIGTAFNIGTSIAYRFHREDFGAWEDSLGGLHAPGFAAEGQVFGDSWKLRMRTRVHLDLMGVNAQSSDRWQDAHLDEENGEIGKSILLNNGYYYAMGASGSAMAELELPHVTLGGSVFVGQYYSIEGYDRIRDELAYEVRGNSSFLDLEGWVRAKVYENYYAEARFGEHRREGQLGEFFDSESMQRLTLDLGAEF